VAHTIYILYYRCDLSEHLSGLECLGLFIGSLCHDLDHRGTNNTFQKVAQTPLADLYSTSIMEHHHFNHAIFILHLNGFNILDRLSEVDYKIFLRCMENAILDTDLANHFKNMKNYVEIFEVKEEEKVKDDKEEEKEEKERGRDEKVRKNGKEKEKEKNKKSTKKKHRFNTKRHLKQQSLQKNKTKYDDQNYHHHSLLMGLVMTCGDLSNTSKPWPIAKLLARIVYSEFCDQGDQERQMGLQPMELMDRFQYLKLPSLQIQFVQSLCIPAFKLLTNLLPKSKPYLDGLYSNLEKWEKCTQEELWNDDFDLIESIS